MLIGATYLGDQTCEFRVWGPTLDSVSLKITEPAHTVPMTCDAWGYWSTTLSATPGTRYYYQINDSLDRPDPASQFQPEGVHKASEVVDHRAFQWTDSAWTVPELADFIIYELHVGTFSAVGTFEGAIPYLALLKELGITAVEIMPVAQFPGGRNWGYDGAYPFAVQNSYGGPQGLKQFVNACHQSGLAVILDVVYNHLGPEGNYTRDFGPYFTEKYQTPWGSALNYDDAYSYGVREYFIQNALYWFNYFHIDALRLDAIHAIYDASAKHFLEELAERVQDLSQDQGRPYYLIAESDLNDPRIIQTPDQGGYGIHAQWSDDFHHSLHSLLTQERSGYYGDYGSVNHLATVLQHRFAYTWTYSQFRKRYFGRDASFCAPNQFVVCAQNHDQVGNRMLGERLSQLISYEGLKLAAGVVLLSPYIPLLFMGEEYGEEAPFLYFIEHGDPDLVEAVRAGRKREFTEFHLAGDPPDAQSLTTFKTSQLRWQHQTEGKPKVLWSYYQTLIQQRQTIRKFQTERPSIQGWDSEQAMIVHYRQANQSVVLVLNFSQAGITISPNLRCTILQKQLDSADLKWLGPGATLPDALEAGASLTIPPLSMALYQGCSQ